MESTLIESDCTKPGELVFSSPDATDGLKIHQLIAACPPLDPNSVYCNLLQCHHFAGTSVKVERDGRLVAFVSGYIPPGQPEVLFIWQVAVAEAARGQGVGGHMLDHLVDAPACNDVRYMHTTVTPGNRSSVAMFNRFAEGRGAPVSERVLFDGQRHFGGGHDSEVLLAIGPFRP